MNLISLYRSPQLRAYYDSWNNWLFLDWHGSLTMAGVQHDCLALLRSCCAHPCQRVLNSNAQVHTIHEGVVPWVEHEFVPYLEQLGVEQLAWVRAALPEGRQLVQQALQQPTQLYLSAFDDVEAAVEWLQDTQPSGCSILPRLPGERERLEACVEKLLARAGGQQP